jgi:prepilin-type N-terminal cleavage/methylation domain-containing protein
MYTLYQRQLSNQSCHQVRGFTIVEMMVSLALFTIVITIATGSFLSLIGGSSQLQGEQQTMTSLNFAMDSMTREIRTGTRYFCTTDIDSVPDYNDRAATTTQDCVKSSGNNDVLSFVESGVSLSGGSVGNRIVYYLDSNGQLMRQAGDPSTKPAQPMLSSDVKLKRLQFFVSGANNLTDKNDLLQPTVTIILEAYDPNDSTNVYTLETTVTQRELDL